MMNIFFNRSLPGRSHCKDNGASKLQLLLFSMLLFAGIPLAQAQCTTGCNSNYGFNSNNDAATIEYDNIVSASGATVIKETDGTFKVWGPETAADGISNVLSPTIINSTNYPGLQGNVLKASISGTTNGSAQQVIILTTAGIYAWGNYTSTSVFPSPFKTTRVFGRVSITGSNAYDLPDTVTPNQVKSLFASDGMLIMLTCTGEVWVISGSASASGAGLSSANTSWNRVTTTEPGNPTLNNVIAVRGAFYNPIALRSDGTLWTWGPSGYLGDGTAPATRNRATPMTLPPNPGGTIKMIGGMSNSYYVLYTDGKLYSMGANANRELGDWTTTDRTTWVQPKYSTTAGTEMNDISWISPAEHQYYTKTNSVNVLTAAGRLYNWGGNYQSKLRSGGSTAFSLIDPGSPNTDKFLAVESSTLSTIAIRQCTQNYGFAGDDSYGRSGDGVSSFQVMRPPFYYSTAPVNVCGVNAMTTAGAPVFNAGLPTNRCQGAGTQTYTATSSGGTVSYSISGTGTGTQPTINPTTGEVTYAANWSGTATITATATGGCGTPETAAHTVITAATPAAPVFGASLSTQRCTGAGTVTYTATSANADSITYSISNTGTGTQPTINPATGEVTYAANWSGTSTITATATGCSTTASSTYVVSTAAVQAVADAASGDAATPLSVNVLANDLCNPDPATLTIVTQPANGTVQIGAGGIVTYLPNGDFSGTDTFVYQVCKAPLGACSQATVTVTIAANLTDVCSTAALPKTFYLPFPENKELKKALMSAGNDATNNTTNARRVISIRANYSATIIYYDHWEDGYEPTTGTRTQSTTEIWGDGNTSNGTAPGYPTDIFPEGSIITIDNTNAYRTGDGRTATETTFQYDGRDKIYSTKLLTLTKVTGSDAAFPYQNTKENVIDTNKFGRLFVVPFGENIASLANPTIPTTVFNYTSLFVRAAENGTVVQLDYNGDGVVDVTSPTLAEGMVWFYDGTASAYGTVGTAGVGVNQANDIKAGAVVTSNKPVGVDLVFGGIDGYGTRNIPLLPGNFYGSTYYSPVYTATTNEPVYAVFSNILSQPITVNWKNGLGASGTVTIPAKGYTSLQMTQATGYKFVSADGKSYTAVTIIDADANGAAYDWAFNMIPEEQLTNFATTAWAPGMASSGAANPVWVTPTKSTTVYVKYTGSVISTAPGLTSPCGLKYDIAYTLSELQSQKVFTSTGNSGMSFFTCDGTPISAVYGEDSSVALSSGATTLDVGFTLDPQCIDFVIFANDDHSQTYPNVPVTIDILNNDVGRVAASTVTITTQPSNGTVVVNPDGTATYTPNPGFSGTDTFNYNVCNSDRSLCSTATVTVDVGCLATELRHILTGKIFDDADKDGIYDNGEGGVAHTVNLYLDANGNGILDASENTPVQSVTTDNTGAYIFDRPTPTPTTQASHDFATASYTAGTGWSAGWVEENEATSPTSGNIQIVTGELRITGTTAAAIRRSVSAPATNALLSFDYRTANLDGLPYKTLEVEVAPSATGPWTSLGALYTTTGFTNGKKVYNIPASVVNANTTIRFRTTGAGNHFFYIDNVAIQSIPTVNYIVQLAEPLPANRYQTLPVFPQKGYAVALSGYKTSCSNNFGLAISSADVKVSKVGPLSAQTGSTISYNIHVTNNGPNDAANVVVKDPAVANFTATGITCTAGAGTLGLAQCPASVTLAELQGTGLIIPTLPDGSTVRFTITGTVGNVAGTVINNVANVEYSNDTDTTNNSSAVNTEIYSCISDETTYTIDVDATLAANTIAPNGGTVNMIYKLSSGTAIPSIGNQFTLPVAYSDLNNRYGVDNQWEGLGKQVTGAGSFVVIAPKTSAGTGRLYNSLPANNSTDESLMASNNHGDNIFTSKIASGELNPLGNFSISIGNYPATPAGYVIKTHVLNAYANGNRFATASVNQSGFWLKQLNNAGIRNDGTEAVNSSAMMPGSSYMWRYSAFSNGSNFVDNNIGTTGVRGVTFWEDSSITFAKVCVTACYKPGITAGTALDTKVGITALSRAGADDPDNWPMARKGGHIALESKTNAFVPNRVAFDATGNPVGIDAANFVEGMMVYDTTNKCMKMYTLKEGTATMAWYCISTQTCPD